MSNAPHRSLDRLRKRKRPPSKRVGIVMDSDYQEAIENAERRLGSLQVRARAFGGTQADRKLAADLEDAEEAVERAKAAALEHTEWFIAKALPPREYNDLIDKHPPTPEQKKEARKENRVVPYNHETFAPELISRCVYLVTKLDEPDPETGETERHDPLPPEFVKEMFEGGEQSQWNQGELVTLARAAQDANQAAPARVEALGNA